MLRIELPNHKKVLEKNYDKKDISDITGLTSDDIKKLENQEQS